MKHKKIFLMTLLIVLITSISLVSATDNTDNDTTTIIEDTTIPDNTIETPQKTINKIQETMNTKEATISVQNYGELYQKLTDRNAEEETTITLDGTSDVYNITSNIQVNNKIKKFNNKR